MNLVLDSSAVISVILRESEWELFRDRMERADRIVISAATLLEIQMVLTGRMRKDASELIDGFMARIGAEVVPFSHAHWRVASEAFLRFGKGRHRAALNFGDCIAHATARL